MREIIEQVSQQETKEKQLPSRVFVDLGSGVWPSAFSGNREFKDSDYYVGVDISRKKIEDALSLEDIARNRENVSRVNKNILFIEGDAASLPFGEKSVDEVFLGNVLGETAIRYIDDFLPEVYRILKLDGSLVILETITPSVAERRSEEGIESLMSKFGFEKVKEIKNGDQEFEAEILKFAGHMERYTKDDDFALGNEFVVYFRKKS